MKKRMHLRVLIFNCCQRPYHVVNTGSRLITADKQRWAWLVLGWVTAWEHHVLLKLILNIFQLQLNFIPVDIYKNSIIRFIQKNIV